MGEAPEQTRGQSVDALTQLPGRGGFATRLRESFDKAQRTGRPLAALMLNVDHFSSLSDQFGTERADEVLRKVLGQ